MSRRRKYARGRKSRAICERTGFEIAYKNLVREPGTNLRVDKRMSDGYYNRVDHPQNFSPKDLTDAQALELATGNENFAFANCNFVQTRLYDEDGSPLLTSSGTEGEQILATFTRIAFNSLKRIE